MLTVSVADSPIVVCDNGDVFVSDIAFSGFNQALQIKIVGDRIVVIKEVEDAANWICIPPLVDRPARDNVCDAFYPYGNVELSVDDIADMVSMKGADSGDILSRCPADRLMLRGGKLLSAQQRCFRYSPAFRCLFFATESGKQPLIYE